MSKFVADVKAFSDLSEKRISAVFKQSAQELFSMAQTPKGEGGNMPVDTGFLRNSLQMDINGMPVSEGSQSYTLAILNADFGDVITGTYQAAYALRMEQGFVGRDSLGRSYNQTGNFFVKKAAMQWQQIVRKNVNKARALK